MKRSGFKRPTLEEVRQKQAEQRNKAILAPQSQKPSQAAFSGTEASPKQSLERRTRLKQKPDPKLVAWSKAVRERDDYTCQMTGIRDAENNIAHHVAPRSLRPDLRLDVDNGVTLTREAHKKVHYNPIWARENGWLSSETYEASRRKPEQNS